MSKVKLPSLLNTWVLCFLLLASSLSSPLRAAPLIMVANDWCPYSCAQDDLLPGYVVELMRDIFAEMNIAVEYRVVPWSRAIRMVEQNKASVLLATTFKDTPRLPLSDLVGLDTSCFYAREDAGLQDPDMARIKQLRLGVIQDFSYDNGGELDTYIASALEGKTASVLASSGANALQSNFEKIAAGRIDLLVENCNVGDFSLQRFALEGQIRKVGTIATYRNGLLIGFNPDDPRVPQWIERVNRRVAEKRSNGELQILLHKYGLRDWQ